MMNISDQTIASIQQLCTVNKVKFLWAFGSVTSEDFNAQSDIDFLVDFKETDPLLYAEYYFELKMQLENLLQRPIDLLEDRAINNRYFIENVNQTKIPIYGYQD